jgi:hypothetical protein
MACSVLTSILRCGFASAVDIMMICMFAVMRTFHGCAAVGVKRLALVHLAFQFGMCISLACACITWLCLRCA